ncbi:MAG: FecR domain-containing protein [Bdellovibrionales bacterium]|nr:FecR domain-containing protein [Bdellovibrionales bacterium]
MNVFVKCFIASAFLLAGGLARAQNVHGVLRVVKGDVQIKSAKTGQTGKARLGSQVYPKDTIITGKDARAKIVMVDNNEINVSPESQIEIQNYEYDPNAGKKDVLLNVIYGKVRSKVEQKYDGKTTKFQIKTPSAVAGVRGTDFLTSFNRSNGASQIVTFEGKVEFGVPGPNGSIANAVMVSPGNQATSVAGAAPAAPAPVPKEELAKMETDTKADTAPAKAESDSRQPAEDKKEKKDDAKKDDGAKKSEAGGAKGAAASGSAKSESSSSSDGSRAPASASAGPSDSKSSGGCTMCGPPAAPPPPPPVIGGGVQMPSIPQFVDPTQKCDHCREAIESGKSTNLKINVRTN